MWKIPCIIRASRPLLAAAICIATVVSAGCLPRGISEMESTLLKTTTPEGGWGEGEDRSVDEDAAEETKILPEVDAEPITVDPPAPVEDLAETWNDLFREILACLDRDALDDARQNLARLQDLDVELTGAQTDQLAAVRVDLERRLQDNELRTTVQLLASPKREDVLAAQERLFERSGAALPLLRESVRGEDPLLVKNSLEMLRRLQQPETTLPIMVGVLERVEQQRSWPDTVREIELTASPGAGELLLRLALSAEAPGQRIVALDALAKVVDPPPQTLVALLPLLHQDGPESATALAAAHHALLTHGQYDLVSGRGLGLQLTPAQRDLLGTLPERLSALIEKGKSDPSHEAGHAAKRLAISMRQVAADPLAGIKVLAFGGEMNGSPAVAVLDGQWNTVDAKQMWRHPLTERGSLVLDLGRERTVAGIRIWNLNEANGMHRGWKEVSVFVGQTAETLAKPVAGGMVPQAPGAVDRPDFSTTVPVGFVRGRYVRLRAESVWRADSHGGLTEVQVLGY